MSGSRRDKPPLRVLVISHTAQSRAAGQARSLPLVERPEIACRLLVPDRWWNYGRWDFPEPSSDARLIVEVGRIAWPAAGPAQWYLHWYRRLGRLLREFRPDVIHLWEEPWSLVSNQVLALRNRLLPATRVLIETEQNIEKRLPFPFERFRRYSHAEADLLIGRTQAALDVAAAKGYRGPGAVIPYGIDEQLFRPLDRIVARRAAGVDGFVIGYAGRLVAEKGLHTLLAAAATLPAYAMLLLVGSGPARPALERQARALNLGGRVRFVPPCQPEALAALYNAMDVLVLPSHTTARWKEQFGRVIIEAQACGVPVIGSSSGAIPQVVGAGGLVVPERDSAALSAALRLLEQDPAKRLALGRVARERVLGEYLWRTVSDRLAELYLAVERRTAERSAPARLSRAIRQPDRA